MRMNVIGKPSTLKQDIRPCEGAAQKIIDVNTGEVNSLLAELGKEPEYKSVLEETEAVVSSDKRQWVVNGKVPRERERERAISPVKTRSYIASVWHKNRYAKQIFRTSK